ncbi:RNA recognition motif 2 [Musa troglodytarum]|uniref:RNA recognition motif 2 n=1 Tax=Musa troglodytarum TaxID=320322 RepID=A0A9E7G9T5_9LILI|nr:RNA recognition motif 2 [Musa troglodytarum]
MEAIGLSVTDSHKGTQSTHDGRKGKDPMDDVGIMLPDDEAALLSGALDCLDLNESPGQVLDALEDYDLFCGGGKMELDSDPKESITVGSSLRNVNHRYTLANGVGTISVAHPHGEHPSRTLFVRNVGNNVEDCELRSLFEKFGEIRGLYTACKSRGFVMISFYDIRAAQSARHALQNMPLRRRNLDIHYSIPKDNPSNQEMNQGTIVVFNLRPSLSTVDIAQIFAAYGEIKEMRETPRKRHHKFIEFYDVRAAESALRSLHNTEIAGVRLKIEPSRPGGTRRNSMQQLSRESEQDESIVHGGLSIANSSPGSWPQLGIPNDIPYCQQDTRRNDDIPLEFFTKSAANPTGLSGYRDKISSSSSSPLQGGGSQRSHSFPYLGCCAQGGMTSISGN